MLAYGTLMEGANPEARADLDAYLEGRELPSVARARVEKADEEEAKRASIERAMSASRMVGARGPAAKQD